MYKLRNSKKLERKLAKLNKKKPELMKAFDKKIEEILHNPSHYKPLRGPLKNTRRVHIGSYVLMYDIIEEEKIVLLLEFEHHDKVYVKKH